MKDLDNMKYRVTTSREQLSTHLKRLGTPGDWDFITKQVGISTLLLNDGNYRKIGIKLKFGDYSSGYLSLVFLFDFRGTSGASG